MNSNVDEKKFIALLEKLAEKDIKVNLTEIQSDLENLYWNSKNEKMNRHYYSKIFAFLSIYSDDLETLEIISNNMRYIKENYLPNVRKDKNNDFIDVSLAIDKLYDHINLDCARITYTNSIKMETSNKFENIEKTYEQIRSDISNVQKDYNKMEDSIERNKIEYITILGIFASIVLAFVGGITFSTSVLNNIGNASIYRIVLASLIIGFVFYNIIYALFEFLRKINGDKGEKSKLLFYIFNGLVVLMMIVTVFAYSYNWVNVKHMSVEQSENEIIETTTSDLDG